MEFKIRYSNTFVMNIILMILALFMTGLDFFFPVFKEGFLHYQYGAWLLLFLTSFIQYRKYLFIGLTDKPVLIINEVYINDLARNTKYYWCDIREVYEKNGYLRIILYNPTNYLSSFHNAIKRFWAKHLVNSKKRTPYIINIDVVDVNPNVLLELLDDYSIEAAQ